MKTKTLLVAAVMFLGLTAAAFAQATATFEAGSIPRSAVIQTGNTEPAGDITFTHISGTTQLGTITIQYGLKITNANFGDITLDQAGFTATTNSGLSSLSTGKLVINIPAGVTPTASLPYNFIRVKGVRLYASGQGTGSVGAYLTAVNNAIVAGQQNLMVINAMLPGIETDGGPGVTVHSGLGIPLSGEAWVDVMEYFAHAFGGAADDGATKSQVVKFELDILPPPGLSIKFPGQVTGSGFGTVWQTTDETSGRTVIGTDVIKTSSSTTKAVYYRNTGPDADPTSMEDFMVPLCIEIEPGSKFLAALPVNIHVTLDRPSNTFVPRYEVEWSPAAPNWIPVVMFTQPRTQLLVPFGQNMNAIGYNTGIAIANTTTDPGLSVMGLWINTATPQAGKIVMYGYGRNATTDAVSNWVFDSSAAGRPGQGLDVDGKLPSGQTYTVMLSEVLDFVGAAGAGNWRGYIIVVTDFTNGHGMYTISNFETYSQGQAMNVFQWPRWGALGEGLLQ